MSPSTVQHNMSLALCLSRMTVVLRSLLGGEGTLSVCFICFMLAPPFFFGCGVRIFALCSFSVVPWMFLGMTPHMFSLSLERSNMVFPVAGCCLLICYMFGFGLAEE